MFGTADTECGAFAEFVCVPSEFVVRKPKDVTWASAAAVPTAGMTALQALRTGRPVARGDRVLINGASGGVGTFAVQLAKSMGAHVTAVCSTRNAGMVRSLGADVVVDYRKESIDATGVTFDKIIDAVGRLGWHPLLSPGGIHVAVALPNPESECLSECVVCNLCAVLCSPWCCCCLSSTQSYAFMQEVSASDMEELGGMLNEGTLRAELGRQLVGIDKLPDALAGHSTTIGQGHTVGKTVVTIDADPANLAGKQD